MSNDKKIADKLQNVTGNEEFNSSPKNTKKLPDNFFSPPPPPPPPSPKK
jgi:hypothetical protein